MIDLREELFIANKHVTNINQNVILYNYTQNQKIPQIIRISDNGCIN